MKLRALLFDVDGTLADTERDGHRVAFNRAFKAAGLDWHWSAELYGELLAVTGGKERIRRFLDLHADAARPEENLDTFIASLHQSKTEFYTKLLAQGCIPLRPGVERLLREAREAGLRLAVATTTTPANVEALLTHTLGEESIGWFDVIAAGDVVPAKKPAADIYEFALRELNLKPQECITFEDSENGILSSRGAGLATIVTVNGYTHGHRFDDAILVIDQMGEPEHPFKVLAGEVDGAQYLDIALIEKLHERFCE